jgi:hypothetical protein
LVIHAAYKEFDASQGLEVVVTPAGLPPTVTDLPGSLRLVGGQSKGLDFEVADPNGDQFDVAAQVVPAEFTSAVHLSGSGIQRRLEIAPAAGASGSFVVTVVVQDSTGLSQARSIQVEVVRADLVLLKNENGWMVSWPDVAGLELQVSDSLSGTWQPVSGSLAPADSQRRFVIAAQQNSQFFRLSISN